MLRCYKISNHSLTTLSQSLSRAKSLETLKLQLGRCDGIDDDGLIKLSHIISQMKSLRVLTLDFTKYSVSLQGSNICFSFRMRSTRITEKGLIELSKSISENRLLIELELNFGG